MNRFQLRLLSPKAKAPVILATVMPHLRELFGAEATFDFRVHPSRYDAGHTLTYIDINKPEEVPDA